MSYSIDDVLSDINETPKNNKNKYYSKCGKINPSKKYNVTIPKIIFQTCWSHDIPPKWQSSPESIKNIMPDWKYVLMDDEENREFVIKHFPDFLPYYDAFPYNIQRADCIRYMWLYINGGIYIDMDLEVLNPLDELFSYNNDVYLCKSGNVGSYFTNSFMASKPRCKFWLEVIEEMKKPLDWYYLGRHTVVMNSTGPIMLSHVAKKTDTVIGILPAKRIMPCSICNLKCATCESYLKPLEGSSWTSFDTTFYNFWLCNWKTVVAFLICLFLLILVFWIIRKYTSVNISFDPRDFYRSMKNFYKTQ